MSDPTERDPHRLNPYIALLVEDGWRLNRLPEGTPVVCIDDTVTLDRGGESIRVPAWSTRTDPADR